MTRESSECKLWKRRFSAAKAYHGKVTASRIDDLRPKRKKQPRSLPADFAATDPGPAQACDRKEQAAIAKKQGLGRQELTARMRQVLLRKLSPFQHFCTILRVGIDLKPRHIKWVLDMCPYLHEVLNLKGTEVSPESIRTALRRGTRKLEKLKGTIVDPELAGILPDLVDILLEDDR